VITPTVTGDMACALATRLRGHGFQVLFPPGRDPAVFKVTGLPGNPDVEVTAEEDGQTACHYAGRSIAEAAKVIARLPQIEGDANDVAIWGGIDVEWHYQPPAGQPASPDEIAAVLLAHLAVLDGHQDPEGRVT